MSKLPEGWASVELGVLSSPLRPRCTPSDFSQLPFIGMEQIEAHTRRLLGTVPSETMKSTAFRFFKGDVLYGRLRPYLNKVYCADFEGLCSSEFIVLPSSGSFLSKYLHYYLNTEGFVAFANQLNQGDRPRVSFDQIATHRIPLSPLDEQHRIVTKLDMLLSKVDACQRRLTEVPRILKRFRQSVVEAACSGKLTADWRGRSDDEDLPASWQWVQLDNLLPRGGIFDGPFGSNLKSSDYTNSGVRVVRLENIGHLTFFDEKETFISKEKYSTLTKHTVGQGDIIFSSFIVDEVRACVLPHFKTKAIAKADCFCLRPNQKLVDNTYLTFQLVSRESYNRLLEDVHGATRPRVNTTQLRKLHVRVCPLPEQQEIVRRVEALFKTADALEARYLNAKEHVDKLTQSILSKAFKGGLVPTEAELARREGRDYEPASALLERMQQVRSRPQPVPKRTSKQTSKPIRRAGKKRDTSTGRLF